jgi:hypothetical protein
MLPPLLALLLAQAACNNIPYPSTYLTLYAATGFAPTCIDPAVSCTQNPNNKVANLLTDALTDPAIYNNNAVCNDPLLIAAMLYIPTPQEVTFATAQIGLFKLCGTQNGAPCMAQCTTREQIDDTSCGNPPPSAAFAGFFVATAIITSTALFFANNSH